MHELRCCRLSSKLQFTLWFKNWTSVIFICPIAIAYSYGRDNKIGLRLSVCGATEIAGVDNVARAKKQGLKTREWTSRHEEAGVDIARVDNVARRGKGGQRRSERS